MMRISTNWINDYVDIKNEDLKDVADKVTKAGVNVEGYEQCKLNNLVIGLVKSVEKHPDSDHLNVCMVDLGDEINQIVCGAHNVCAGIKVIVAKIGAILPGDFEIKQSTIRGVESNGMICALYELGLEEKNEQTHAKGIHIINDDVNPGEDVVKYLGLDDVVYGLDLNPNRNDCLSHLGFAYEVAAVLNKEIKLPSTTFSEEIDNINNHFSLSVETDLCTMYNAKMVTGIVIKESPDFIKRRLNSAGIRSINNVVDISNYIMLEYGQPLHFFDKDKLGDRIVVRTAEDQEKTITLDSKERILNSNDIVITNSNEIVAIAGVMGCLNSEIDSNTKNILIESAIFNPYNVRYTSINLDLRSESSLRFEKGLNYEYTIEAINRACHLLEKYAGGKVLSGITSYDNVDKTPKLANVTRDKINKVLGMELTHQDIMKSFDSLGFEVECNENTYNVTIPNRRMDVSIKEDLIEEVGRLYGYDNIIGVLPIAPTIKGSYSPFTKYRKDISKRMRSLGLDEARTHTLISEEENNLFEYYKGDVITLDKPMSMDKSIIRQSLIPSLLNAVDYNKARGVEDIKLYEISNTYSTDLETTKLGCVLTGHIITNSWNNTNIKIDFYVVKGIIEDILNYLGLNRRYTFNISNNVPKEMHPGMSAEIVVDNEALGYFGKVHPSLRKDDIYVIEINLNKLYSKKVRGIKFVEASKYPSINKDLAFITKRDISSSEIEKVIKRSAGKLLTNIDVFDVYVGENLLSDEKSIAYSLTFSDSSRTLMDDEITTLLNKIISDVEAKTKSKLRNK